MEGSLAQGSSIIYTDLSSILATSNAKVDAYSLTNDIQGLQMVTRISHDTCTQANTCATCPFAVIFSAIMQSSQSVPVSIGALLNQIRQACGNQPPQIVIGGPQAVLANSGD